MSYMLSWPQARSSSVISGELLSLGQGGASREIRAFVTLLSCGGGPSLFSTHPQETLCSLTLNICLIPGLSPWERNRAWSFPWPSGGRGWVAGFLSQPWVVLVLVLVYSSQENHQRGLLPLPVAWCPRFCLLWEPKMGFRSSRAGTATLQSSGQS